MPNRQSHASPEPLSGLCLRRGLSSGRMSTHDPIEQSGLANDSVCLLLLLTLATIFSKWHERCI